MILSVDAIGLPQSNLSSPNELKNKVATVAGLEVIVGSQYELAPTKANLATGL